MPTLIILLFIVIIFGTIWIYEAWNRELHDARKKGREERKKKREEQKVYDEFSKNYKDALERDKNQKNKI